MIAQLTDPMMNRLKPPAYRVRIAVMVALAGAATLVQTSVSAQATPGDGRPVTLGVAYETYRFAEPDAANLESLTLATSPFTARTTLLDRASIDVRGAFARAELQEADGTTSTLAGLTDTEIAVSVGFEISGGMATVTGIALAPTGKTGHDADESRIAGLIASELFPFRITNWGTGGGAGVSANFARPLSDGANIGIGVGYLAAREYEPLSVGGAGFAYRPGDQVQLRLAVDRNLGTSAKASVALVFQRHQEDQLDGANLYLAGNRFQSIASYAFAVGPQSSAIVYAGGLHSADGVALQPLAHDHSSRTLFLLGGGLRVPFAGMVALPSVDARLFRRGSGSGQGYLGGVGASLEIPAAGSIVAPNVRLRVGNLVVDESRESGITAADLGVTIRIGSPDR